MIFGYTLGQARKFVVSGLFTAGYIVAFLVLGGDLSFVQAAVALSGPAFALAGVFLSKNHTFDDFSKAVAQLQGAALSVVGYFTVVPTSTLQQVGLIVGGVVSVVGVWYFGNDPAPSKKT